MSQTQNLGSTSYSLSHKNVLKTQDRLRVAKQLSSIIKDYTKNTSLKNLKVLDVGCSSGIITNYISNYTDKTIGIDIDSYAINQASSNFKNKNLSFIKTGSSSIPFNASSFDIVICNQVYSYTSNPNKMIKEINRILKKDGFCLFTGDNLLRPIEPLYNIPFFRWIPSSFAKFLLRTLGYKNYYVGKYKTLWGIKKMCNLFIIYDYTIKVLQNPKLFNFSKLVKFEKITKLTPEFILKLFEPLFPTYIFILQKKQI